MSDGGVTDVIADQDGWDIHSSTGDHQFVGTEVVIERAEDGDLVKRRGVIAAIWEFPGQPRTRRRRARERRRLQHGARQDPVRLTSVRRTTHLGHTFKAEPPEADRQHAQLLNERLKKRDDPRGPRLPGLSPRLTSCFFGPNHKRCSLSGHAAVRADAGTRRARQRQIMSPRTPTRQHHETIHQSDRDTSSGSDEEENHRRTDAQSDEQPAQTEIATRGGDGTRRTDLPVRRGSFITPLSWYQYNTNQPPTRQVVVSHVIPPLSSREVGA